MAEAGKALDPHLKFKKRFCAQVGIIDPDEFCIVFFSVFGILKAQKKSAFIRPDVCGYLITVIDHLLRCFHRLKFPAVFF